MTKHTKTNISDRFIEEVCNALKEGRRLRRKLPSISGEIFVDRQLPYLIVYRFPRPQEKTEVDGDNEKENEAELLPDWGTDHLLFGESSYLIAPADEDDYADVNRLVEAVARELRASYGAFLVLEIWSGPEVKINVEKEQRRPDFKILAEHELAGKEYLKTLAKELSLVELEGASAHVSMHSNEAIKPDHLKELLSKEQLEEVGIDLVGLEVSPVYRDLEKKHYFTLELQVLQRQFTNCLEKMFFEFLKTETTICPPSYLALGKRSRVHSVVQVDRILSEVADEIDFLLLVTPTNTGEAYHEFKHNLFQKEPHFTYHPAPFDPVLLKRKLYSSRVEQIEDPTLAQLFREQQFDIDHRINMIIERGTRKFLYSSLQLYEKPDDALVALADKILRSLPEVSTHETLDKQLSSKEFADRAQEELDFYKKDHPDLPAAVVIRDDVPGVLVSQGNLIIGKERRIPLGRAEALLSHEVGTHILTNYNGKAQPFRQLSAGLPGYDELQEPLAVLSEYLVGGLSNRRMRTLAMRVMAVHWLVEGASFVEVFRNFTKEYELHREISFSVAMRVFRGGGFTKDVVYLRGLLSLLDHLRHGLDIEMLYVGKFGLSYLPIIRELLWRNVLVPARLKPHFFQSEEAMKRLAKVREGATVMDLVKK